MDGGAQAASNERRPGWPQRVSGERAWAHRPTLDVGESRSKPSPKYQPTRTARFAPNSITSITSDGRATSIPSEPATPAIARLTNARRRRARRVADGHAGPRPQGCEGQDGRATYVLGKPATPVIARLANARRMRARRVAGDHAGPRPQGLRGPGWPSNPETSTGSQTLQSHRG
jgi:hypothetical protein